jgi:hypothetical protein
MMTQRRIPLNPCDNCIYGHHRWLSDRQRGGNIPFMMVDLVGHIEPSVLRSALAAVFLAHPATMGTLRTSPFRLRPFWQLPSVSNHAALQAAERAYIYDDLRTMDDSAARLDRLCNERYTPDWDLARGPQVRLEHYDLPGEETRLCLRWPHFLMDAEGAQGFLAELERQRQPDHCAESAPFPWQPDDRPVDVLSGTSALERLRLTRSGLFDQKSSVRGGVRPLTLADPNRFEGYQALHRCWEDVAFDRIRENAKRVTPFGPALYARHLAGAVIRALERIYREERIETSAYLITFPMRVRRPDLPDDVPFHRPLIGNYLVTPTLTIPRDQVGNESELGATILQQYQEFLARRGDAAQWALLQAASIVHAWAYPLIFRFPIASGTFSSGFSYYGEIESPLRGLAGAKVANIWGGGPTTTPPGWNPVFSRYGDRLNMSLTWTRPAITDDLAGRYASYIEEFLFAA